MLNSCVSTSDSGVCELKRTKETSSLQNSAAMSAGKKIEEGQEHIRQAEKR